MSHQKRLDLFTPSIFEILIRATKRQNKKSHQKQSHQRANQTKFKGEGRNRQIGVEK